MKVYEIGRFGAGFADQKGVTSLLIAKRRFQRRLRKRSPTGPYTVTTIRPGETDGNTTNKLSRTHAVDKAAYAVHIGDIGTRAVVRSSDPNEVAWVLRSDHRKPTQHPFITRGIPWIGISRYLLGASGPAGHPVDCSGFIMMVVYAVTKISLPHQANLMQHDGRIQTFTNRSLVQQGDLVFYHYPGSSRPSSEASHVEFVDKPGERHLGSRPSTNGVNWFDPRNDSTGVILCYGRVRTGKPLT